MQGTSSFASFDVGPLTTWEDFEKAAKVWEIANSSNYERPVPVADDLVSNLARMASRPCNLVTGVKINDDVIGAAVFCNGKFSMMGVLPEWYGFGLGFRLISERLDFAKRTGWGRVVTETAVWNRRVQMLYEALGWKRNGPVYEFLDINRTPMVMYEKVLSDD